MEIPLQISFTDMDPSPAIEAHIREKAEKLGDLCDRIVACRVAVEMLNRHQRKGRLYNIRISLSVPGKDIFVDHAGRNDQAHEDIKVAIRDAFKAATRQLDEHVRLMRGEVKTHEVPPHGTIARLFHDHGFLQMSDGMEVYFHMHSVPDGKFTELEIGDEARVVVAEKDGEKGPQASTVVRLGKHKLVG